MSLFNDLFKVGKETELEELIIERDRINRKIRLLRRFLGK